MRQANIVFVTIKDVVYLLKFQTIAINRPAYCRLLYCYIKRPTLGLTCGESLVESHVYGVTYHDSRTPKLFVTTGYI
jgi:hypothetical protein